MAIDLRNIGSIYPNGTGTITVPADVDITGTPAPVYLVNGVPIGQPAGSSGQIQFNAGGTPVTAFGASANLFWDNGNARLGIGTLSPQAALDVAGSIICRQSTATGIPIFLSMFVDYLGAAINQEMPFINSWDPTGAGAFGPLGIDAAPLILNFGSHANVGIDTPIPQAKLDVNGNMRVNGNVIIFGGGNIQVTNLPNADPGAGSQQFWYDPADGNRVKFSP